MLKKRLFWIIGVYVALIAFLVLFSPRKIDWRDSFSYNDKTPYGSYIAYEELDHIFDEYDISEDAIYTTMDEYSEYEGNFIYTTSYFSLREAELDNLLQWIEKGNKALISASYFDFQFLDTLNLESKTEYFNFKLLGDSIINIVNVDQELSTTNYIYNKELDGSYLINKFDSLDQARTLSYMLTKDDVLGDDKKAVFIEKKWGNGSIYLNTMPRVFSNYYMLKKKNYEYAALILSYLPNSFTYWDEYYKPFDGSSEPKLKRFMSTPGFRWAIYLGGALLSLYILFRLKRDQRIIPIVTPPENRSLEFTKTIGDLYFNTQDAPDLVEKMERHFQEFIKEKYFIFDFKYDKEDILKLSEKSGHSVDLINKITRLMKRGEIQSLTNSELITLNNHLHTLYYGGK